MTYEKQIIFTCYNTIHKRNTQLVANLWSQTSISLMIFQVKCYLNYTYFSQLVMDTSSQRLIQSWHALTVHSTLSYFTSVGLTFKHKSDHLLEGNNWLARFNENAMCKDYKKRIIIAVNVSIVTATKQGTEKHFKQNDVISIN